MTRNMKTGAWLALAGAAFVCESLRMPAADGLSLSGPKVVPLTASVLMVVSGLGVLVSGALRRRMADAPSGGARRGTVVAVVVLLFVYAWALPVAGFLAATFALLLPLSYLCGLRRPVQVVGLSGIVTVAVWLVFTRLFFANLPAGTLFRGLG